MKYLIINALHKADTAHSTEESKVIFNLAILFYVIIHNGTDWT